MLPKILKNFNVFVDGRGYAGKIDEITLPKLTIKTEEYRAGGMDITVNIDILLLPTNINGHKNKVLQH
ncbi:hypothetical protein wCIFem_11920 [Wolbachia pipientis]